MRVELVIVEEDMEGERLDIFLTKEFDDLSRSLVKNLIESNQVEVDGKFPKASYRLKAGEKVKIIIPEPRELEVLPQNIPIDIIYQDEDIVVVDKPKGMVVHPAPGNTDGTLVNALLYHVKDLSDINGVIRPGIVHRLDKDTSGLVVVAKNNLAHQNLSLQIQEHKVNRIYYALVHGVIKENLGTIDAPIGRSKVDRKKMAVVADGRYAVSDYQVMERFHNYTLVKVKLRTGRTHQIRVHFAYINHPVVGDPLYGSGKKHFDLDSQALHAHRLSFAHPRTGEHLEFESPLPEYMQNILAKLRNEY